jgi:hypothetical protein
MLLVEALVPGTKVKVKTKSLFKKVDYPYSGQSGVVVRVGFKVWEGMVLVKFSGGNQAWIKQSTLTLI